MIALYSQVEIVAVERPAEGKFVGVVGYVIESYDDNAYEVEVSDENGNTVAQFVALEREMLVLPEGGVAEGSE
ncbi:DUF4926 domain-containing protein [Actinokineospora sp.]|uniref:DUF4926 domain-containing protein n=1 Tax=Actinokineospora sp. TaxID=1872133 RepID=UPI003D6B1023